MATEFAYAIEDPTVEFYTFTGRGGSAQTDLAIYGLPADRRPLANVEFRGGGLASSPRSHARRSHSANARYCAAQADVAALLERAAILAAFGPQPAIDLSRTVCPGATKPSTAGSPPMTPMTFTGLTGCWPKNRQTARPGGQ